MKIQILSDLHLEFIRNLDELNTFLEIIVPENESDRDVLVIAGDLGLHTGSQVEIGSIVSALTFFCNQYNLVLYVLGNHEFYHSSFKETWDVFGRLETMINSFVGGEKLKILRREELKYRGKSFVGCTLWFADHPENYFYTNLINDFRFINNNLTDFHVEGAKDFEFIESYFNKASSLGDIIITHHLPTYQSVDAKYKNGKSSLFFVHKNVERLISWAPTRPRLWIHGHTHSSKDYMFGEVRVVCNPSGYPHRWENPHFIPRLIVEV